MDLMGKAALVTGGSGDLGGAIARALATAGVDVAVTYVSRPEEAKATATAVRAAGRRSLIVPLDQRDRTAIDASVETVAREFGRVDILVNNAAWNIGIPFKAIDALTADIWDRVLETNLRGPYLLARACAPHLRAHGAGRIVNTPSTERIDRRRKLELYARYLIEHYWIVDPVARTIDAHTLTGERYRLSRRLEGPTPTALDPFPDLLVDPAALWA